MMNNEGISVVIACHNSSKRLPQTLEHVKQQNVPEHVQWEVIIVDNASTDNTAQIAQSIWGCLQGVSFRIIREPRIGSSYARFTGTQSALYEFVSYIDDDNWVADDWVQTIYEKMTQDPQIGALGGRSEAVFEIDPPFWFERYKATYAIGKQAEREGEMPIGTLLWGTGAIRKSAWQAIIDQGFEHSMVGRKGKQLTSGEDREIVFMLKASGWKLYYTPSLLFYHFIPKERLTWAYVCRSSMGYGPTEIYLDHYWKSLRLTPGELAQEPSWYQEIWPDLSYILVHPLDLIYALFYKAEGKRSIVKMYRHIGRLRERLRLMHRLDEKKDRIFQQVTKYQKNSTDYKNLS